MGKGRGFGMILMILMGERDEVSYATIAVVSRLACPRTLTSQEQTYSGRCQIIDCGCLLERGKSNMKDFYQRNHQSQILLEPIASLDLTLLFYSVIFPFAVLTNRYPTLPPGPAAKCCMSFRRRVQQLVEHYSSALPFARNCAK